LPPSSPKTTDELQNSLGVKLSSASQVKVANAPNRKAQRRNQLDENQVDEVVLAPVPNVARTVSATSLSSSTTPAAPTPWATRGSRCPHSLHHDRGQFQPHRLRVREWMKRKSCTQKSCTQTDAADARRQQVVEENAERLVPRNTSITASAVSCLRPGARIRYRSSKSLATNTKNSTEMTPFMVKNAAFSFDKSSARTNECS
jgi:hypothetical protein